ncbi:uncharacterized protein PHALS_06581 [Plasmopara halstedii]|uniref:Uncharacterized protein n=1 Tax=Plasmopara halstedii TaxID=4781 RepID=A0A0P1B217_PLAHL|nr:uncharacterized protein PHALS_06581 [Plasmopara halstedii]CEG48778.1 hypothetical protein PHALS_06581 [Plasmopara halstedii]|eukprot:XP_024585147.1 hypothetical protein PHALS_06581 [Plasmopara halstedii]
MLKLLLSVVSPLHDTAERWRPDSLLQWAITSGNNSVAIAVQALATFDTPARLKILEAIFQSLFRRDPTHGDADINHKNMRGLTAFDVAETTATKQILIKFGARTARIISVEEALRWNCNRYRDEIGYLSICAWTMPTVFSRERYLARSVYAFFV